MGRVLRGHHLDKTQTSLRERERERERERRGNKLIITTLEVLKLFPKF